MFYNQLIVILQKTGWFKAGFNEWEAGKSLSVSCQPQQDFIILFFVAFFVTHV